MGRREIGASCRSQFADGESLQGGQSPGIQVSPGSPQVSRFPGLPASTLPRSAQSHSAQGMPRLLIIRMEIIRARNYQPCNHAQANYQGGNYQLANKKGKGGRPFLGRASLLS